MSFDELLPSLLSLSRYDKLQLIRSLAEDLASIEVPPSESNNGRDNAEIQEDARVQQTVHAVGLRNTIGRQEEGMPRDGEDCVANNDQAGATPTVASRPYPYWSPDRDSEAAAILMKLLETEKSARDI
jgi:hypothetical protein